MSRRSRSSSPPKIKEGKQEITGDQVSGFLSHNILPMEFIEEQKQSYSSRVSDTKRIPKTQISEILRNGKNWRN